MATFVLIAGGWHGGWCWKKVRAALTSTGHEVFAPSLTGLGERKHLMAPTINLETHIEDIVNLLLTEELSDVVLCGHSYGGVVMSGVADRLTDRVKALVYLDALVLNDGESVYDIIPAETVALQRAAARQVGEGWKIAPAPARAFNVNAADCDWVDRQCTPQPVATFEQPLRLFGRRGAIRNITYLYATAWASSASLFQSYERAKARGWRTHEVACGHDVMVDRPEVVVAELLSAAARSA